MKMPEIGEIITTGRAIELCKHFKLLYLVDRIEEDPSRYDEWQFDGCSCLPNRLLLFITGDCWDKILYECCLPHDLAYAYGKLGSRSERKIVDLVFYDNLVVKAGLCRWKAEIFYKAVRVGGGSWLKAKFSWAFALKGE